jgi:hypothetical protein
VEVRAIDAAGNADASPASFTWTIDIGLPETAIHFGPSNPTNSTLATFSFTGDGTGSAMAGFECKLDAGNFDACTSPQSYGLLGNGSHTVEVRAIDAAGNVDASPASFTWTIDTVAPGTAIHFGPSNPSNSTEAAFSFTGDGTGSAVAGFECKLDAGEFGACTSPKTYSGLGSGSHTVEVRAIDAAGNVDASPASFTWTIDFTPPSRVGDYDGDGDTDLAVYRPSSGHWFMNGGATTAWGISGDIPVPADYDGNGTTDLGVFWPSRGVWFVLGGTTVHFGVVGDIPVPADYDGDGDDDIAVFRPSSGLWFVRGGTTTGWGTNGDIPVPGDYDGDGDDDVAVFRPSLGVWFVQGGATTVWGTNGDIPVPGNYDGDGDTDIAVFRPSNGIWLVSGGATLAWGTSGDVPLPLPDAIRRFSFPPL